MPQFTHILFDLDHTLFDFEESRRVSFAAVLDEAGVPDSGELINTFHRVERPLWSGLERGELTLETLNDRRFTELVQVAGLDADPAAMATSYLEWLGRTGGLFAGARELLDSLNEVCTLALVTNGYAKVQRARMINFDLARYFTAITISDELGVAKPNPAFLDHTFVELGNPNKASTLLVGDSLTSDMTAANQYEISNCWYNPSAKVLDGSVSIDFEVDSLDQIKPIVLG